MTFHRSTTTTRFARYASIRGRETSIDFRALRRDLDSQRHPSTLRNRFDRVRGHRAKFVHRAKIRGGRKRIRSARRAYNVVMEDGRAACRYYRRYEIGEGAISCVGLYRTALAPGIVHDLCGGSDRESG